MPIVKCPNPNCGRERLVVEGKRKKCRKCGTALTANMARTGTRPKTEVEAERKTEEAAKRAAEKTTSGNIDNTADIKTDWETMDRKELRVLAKEAGLQVSVIYSKARLIEMLNEAAESSKE